MAYTLTSKRSSTPGQAPTTAQLQLGEIGINTHDGLLYFVQNTGTATLVCLGPTPATANALTNPVIISLSGDATGTVSFNGSTNVSIATTLATTGVTAGTYITVTVDSKGRVTAGNNVLVEISATLSGSVIDVSTGNLFLKTISGSTTFSVTNVPASPKVASFILELTNGGSAAITWWSGLTWTGGAGPPSLSGSGVDVLGFYTYNGGSTWRGFLLGRGMA